MMVVYIHPRANMADATYTTLKLVYRLHFILSDFNTCSLKKPLSNFYQYVSYPTRYGKVLTCAIAP